MKYRKKPIEVEAWHYKKDNWSDRPHWIDVAILNDECEYLEGYPKYRKKPMEVEAWQYLYDFKDMPIWVENAYEMDIIKVQLATKILEIKKQNLVDIVLVGDWIIKDTEGELSVCSDSVFQKTYEKVEE